LLDQHVQGLLETDLSDIFLKLFCQRFLHKTRKEINMMLLKDFPGFENTVAAKEMNLQGRVEMCLEGANAKFGNLEPRVEKAIQQLTAPQAHDLIRALMFMSSVRELNDWLDSLPSRASS